MENSAEKDKIITDLRKDVDFLKDALDASIRDTEYFESLWKDTEKRYDQVKRDYNELLDRLDDMRRERDLYT